MQLFLEQPDFEYAMRGADGQSALVNERTLRRSFILTPQALMEDWPVTGIASLGPADLQPLLALEPEVVILGCGASQAFPQPEVMAACLTRGIGIEVMTNAAAARTFNVLASEGRRVVAGFVIA